MSLTLFGLVGAVGQPSTRATQSVLCPNADGAIVGLVADMQQYVRPPADAGAGGTNPEMWQLVTEGATGPQNSFSGKYMQVLPDDHDTYNDIYGPGSFTMTGLDWAFDVTTAGMHTLFLRWTAGDTVGGGDSLYVVVRKASTDEVQTGPDTLRPLMVPISQVPGQFTGCCYNMNTHACPCYTPAMNQSLLCTRATSGYWQSIERTSHWGDTRMCEDAHGTQENVAAPRWYLYSGQDVGNVMDFASNPWDATCEAEGTGTADSGHDYARWNLEVGRYHIVFYPREDGTAVNAFYMTPPGVQPPTAATVLTAGASSTQCAGGAQTTPVARTGADLTHRGGDASGWGHHDSSSSSSSSAHVQAGAECGLCLVPINASQCPTPAELNLMQTCDNVQLGEMCEADGECGTNVRINNCDNPTPDPQASDNGNGVRHSNRNNDVYKRISCAEWRAMQGGNVGAGGGSPAVAIVLVLASLVLVGGAGFYVHVSKKNNGGLIVMPWKLFAPRAQTSSSTSSGAGPLAAADVGVATAYVAPAFGRAS